MMAKTTPAMRALIVALFVLVLGGGLAWLANAGPSDDAGAPTTTAVPASAVPSAPATESVQPSMPTPSSSATSTTAAAPSEASSSAVSTAVSVAVPSSVTVTAAGRPPAPAVDAQAYVVFDDATGEVLASLNADESRPVASLMKLLNAEVVLNSGDLEQRVTVPPMETDAKESQIGLSAGETWSRAVLLRAMIIVSANDAARALAVGISGSETAFVEAMNATAQRLGLTSTLARNASGLDVAGQHSSATDMLTLARKLMANDVFRVAAARRTASLHGHTYPATNKLLGVYPGADGVKTGHTTEAGYCFAASAIRDGRRIFVITLGSATDAGRTAAVTALLDWAFAQR